MYFSISCKNSSFLILEPCSSSLDFNNASKKAVVEKEAILRFLVALSGSGTSESPGVLGHHNDLWLKESTQVINIMACHLFFLEFCMGWLLARHKVKGVVSEKVLLPQGKRAFFRQIQICQLSQM